MATISSFKVDSSVVGSSRSVALKQRWRNALPFISISEPVSVHPGCATWRKTKHPSRVGSVWQTAVCKHLAHQNPMHYVVNIVRVRLRVEQETGCLLQKASWTSHFSDANTNLYIWLPWFLDAVVYFPMWHEDNERKSQTANCRILKSIKGNL